MTITVAQVLILAALFFVGLASSVAVVGLLPLVLASLTAVTLHQLGFSLDADRDFDLYEWEARLL